MVNNPVNAAENLENNPGYDQNPQYSPDGNYLAWQSMSRNGYEADRNRLCVYDLNSGAKTYVTESLDTNVDAFTWATDSKTLYCRLAWQNANI
mgnify:CR=1 FL=1